MAENPRLEELRRRVQADPASIAFAALAEEYRRLARYDETIETCLAGLQRHPAYLSARVTLGRALMETGDLDSAREQFETVLRSAPENIAATRGLAQIHERLGHSTEMDPHLAQLMREHVEAVQAAPPPPPPPPPPPEPKPEPEWEPELEPAAHSERPEPEPLEVLTALEPAAAAFDLPLVPIASAPHLELDIPDTPDPVVAAAISSLERFLAAIQHARHA